MTTPTLLRSNVAALSTLAGRDLRAMWQQVDDAAQARAALGDLLPALIETYGLAAASLAADWYDLARDERGIGGSFRSFPAPLPDPQIEAQSLAGWAVATAQVVDTMPALVMGGVHRRIANAARTTVMGSAIADPKASGWKRVGSPQCDFCRMLISRGAVYSEETAHFDAHDSCNCGAAPAWA